MIRTLYRWLLWLHPPAFRREFAGEMLWIFEEASAEGIAPLFADGFVSLLRQWLLRSGQWKLAAALLGAVIEMTAGGLGGIFFLRARMAAHAAAPIQPPAGPAEIAAINSVMQIVLWCSAGMVIMVLAIVCWVHSLNIKRLHRLAAVPRR